MDGVNCIRCGTWFEPKGSWQRKCWPCWRQERDDEPQIEDRYTKGFNEGREKGYAAGYADGRTEGYAMGKRDGERTARPANNVQVGAWDKDTLRELIQLTHPDRHPPERAHLANRVTARLNVLMERHK